MRYVYFASSVVAFIGIVALLFGWDPSPRLVAIAAFVALGSASAARGLQVDDDCG